MCKQKVPGGGGCHSWIADTIGNLTGTITIIFFNLAIVYPKHKKGRLLILIVTIGLIGYELFQYLSARSILDWRDMVATLIAGVISEGQELNPGPWVQHSLWAARAAGSIASHHPRLDPDVAFVMGYLHDIGRREGVTGMRHILDGFPTFCRVRVLKMLRGYV